MDKKNVLENIINACAEGNQAQFARRLGESPQTINAWLKRGTLDPIKIYKTFTCLNPHWLLTGEGDMMKDEAVEQSIVVGDINHVEGPVSVSQSTTKPEPADTAALRARLEAAESLVEALRAQLTEKDQTAAVLRQLVAEKQKLINLLEAR